MGATEEFISARHTEACVPALWALGHLWKSDESSVPSFREIGMYAEFGLQLTCVLLSLRAVLRAHINLGLEEKLTSGKGSGS